VAGSGIYCLDVQFLKNIWDNVARGKHTFILTLGVKWLRKCPESVADVTELEHLRGAGILIPRHEGPDDYSIYPF
jgi:hypothetical protein